MADAPARDVGSNASDVERRRTRLELLSRLTFVIALALLVTLLLTVAAGTTHAADAVRGAVSGWADRLGGQDRNRALEEARSPSQDQYGSPRVAICHLTASGRYRVIVIPRAAVPAHQRHGDIYPVPAGGCPERGVLGATATKKKRGGADGQAPAGGKQGRSGETLPFTGFTVASGLALAGVLLAAGLLLRRRARSLS